MSVAEAVYRRLVHIVCLKAMPSVNVTESVALIPHLMAFPSARISEALSVPS